MIEDVHFHGEEDDEASDPIAFFSEGIDFSLQNPDSAKAWIQDIINQESGLLGFLNIVFCSDTYLHQLNMEYLKHDTLTDIITFPYQDPPRIEGDIFISIDRVRENAHTYQIPFADELFRVMIHGVLHLCGFKDKTPEDQALMRQKEDEALQHLKQVGS